MAYSSAVLLRAITLLGSRPRICSYSSRACCLCPLTFPAVAIGCINCCAEDLSVPRHEIFTFSKDTNVSCRHCCEGEFLCTLVSTQPVQVMFQSNLGYYISVPQVLVLVLKYLHE